MDFPANRMTIRDYFAAKMLTTEVSGVVTPRDKAEYAYEVADAMLEKRDKE